MSWDDIKRRGARFLLRYVELSVFNWIVISVLAFTMAILTGGVVIVLSGAIAECADPFLSLPVLGELCYNPGTVYYYLFIGAINSEFNLAITIGQGTILIFTALSFAIALKAGLLNIGAQGQLLFGALFTALSVIYTAPFVPDGIGGGALLIVIGLFTGAVVGGIYGAIPGLLKAYSGANEVITTIMLNFIAGGVAFFLVRTYFQAEGSQTVQTERIPDVASLRPIVFSDAHNVSLFALVIGILTALIIYWILNNTVYGYNLQTAGIQPAAALYAGVKQKQMVVSTMTISGIVAGMGGAIYILMILGRWRTGIPPVGFDGIAVSILAANNPVGIIPSSMLFGILRSGGLAVDTQVGIPRQLVQVIRGLIILFLAMPALFNAVSTRWEKSLRAIAEGADE